MQNLIIKTPLLEITNIKKKTKEVAYKSWRLNNGSYVSITHKRYG